MLNQKPKNMKKILLFVSVILLSGTTNFAQFNSGSLFVSGSTALSLDLSGQRWKSGEFESDHAHRLTNISFTPAAGYFFKNRMAVGGMIDYMFGKEKADNSTSTSSSLLIGPLARYYFNYSVSGIMPFAEIDAGIGSRSSIYDYGEGTSESKYSVFRISGGAGINYFLSESIAFETRLKYYFKTEKDKEEGVDFKYTYNGILFRFGISVFFSSI